MKFTTQKERLVTFLKYDLEKLEYHTEQIIDNIYARGQHEKFKEDIEQIQSILFYWNKHSDKLNK
tara:strand:+ start:225 stop:419 length:195 start_codon:yes stop_codon:yes gene_type:complete